MLFCQPGFVEIISKLVFIDAADEIKEGSGFYLFCRVIPQAGGEGIIGKNNNAIVKNGQGLTLIIQYLF